MTKINSISSVCEKGQEVYTRFYSRGEAYFQYDYRHKDGELFSTVAETLEQCREKRDRWLQGKNFKRIFPDTLKRIQENKRLTKSDMGYQIGHVDTWNPASLYWDFLKREDLVKTFNEMFGTDIK